MPQPHQIGQKLTTLSTDHAIPVSRVGADGTDRIEYADLLTQLTSAIGGGGGGGLDTEAVQDAVNAMLVAGTNITKSYNDGAGTLTISAAGATGPAGPGGDHRALSVKAYGAVGNGSTNDTTAIRNCIAAAISSGIKAVFFPAGKYIVSPDVLTPALGSALVGFTYIGEGPYASILEMAANQSTTSYFYDNKTSGTTLQYAKFVGLGFQGGPTDTATQRANVNPNHNGFRVYGPNDQNFRFINCRFATLNGVLFLEGGNNASENGYLDCKITHISGYVLKVNNLQALNTNYVNTDIEIVWGNVVQIESGKGGGTNFFGGSMIVQGTGKFLQLNGAHSAGFNVFGSRFELRDSAMFVNSSTDARLLVAAYGACFSTIATSGTVKTVSIRGENSVAYYDCTFETNGSGPSFEIATTSQQAFPGSIDFVRSSIWVDMSDRISFPGGYGRASARDCRIRYNANNTSLVYATDFDLGPSSSAAGSALQARANASAKRVWIKLPAKTWPKSNGSGGSTGEFTVQLPVGAIISRIVIRKPAGGANANNYQLQVSNDDKSTVYGSSTLAAQNVAHNIDVSPYTEVGSSANSRVVRVSVTGSTSNSATADATAGWGFVEYM